MQEIHTQTGGKRGKNKMPASGSLCSVSAGKYPDGSPKPKRWLYSYSVRKYGEWRTIKVHVANDIKPKVNEAIESKKGIDFILNILGKSLQTSEFINAQKSVEAEGFFKLKSFTDTRKRTFRAIVQRQGQQKFRAQLLDLYNRRCIITDFDAEKTLEAAHIHPYKGDETNELWNGLLLRADIHNLFDFNLITINPENNQVCIAPELKNTQYRELDGKVVRLPKIKEYLLRKEMLKLHYEECNWA